MNYNIKFKKSLYLKLAWMMLKQHSFIIIAWVLGFLFISKLENDVGRDFVFSDMSLLILIVGSFMVVFSMMMHYFRFYKPLLNEIKAEKVQNEVLSKQEYQHFKKRFMR